MLDEIAEGCLTAGLEALLQGCVTQLLLPLSPFVLAVVLGVTWQSYWVGGFAFLGVVCCMFCVAALTDMHEKRMDLAALALDGFLALGILAKVAVAGG